MSRSFISNTLFCFVCLLPQMGPRTHGGWVAAMKSTSTGGARGLASRNAPVASTGTAPTPSMTATVTQTTNSGKSESPAGEQRINTTLLQSVNELQPTK